MFTAKTLDIFWGTRRKRMWPKHHSMQEFKYQLGLGDPVLELPYEHKKARGVYVSVNDDGNYWVREGNAQATSVVYYSNRSIWVPASYLFFTGERAIVAPETFSQQYEETTMDLVSLVMADQLFAIGVHFANSARTYTYKSQEPIEVGAKIVVDTPSTGMVVVTVVSCEKGLDTSTDKFAQYKWVVDTVNVVEYERLKTVEATMVAKAKAKKRLDEAKAQLEQLGVTQEELIALVKGA